MHRDIAFEVEAIAAATAEDQQRACDLWKADFNNCRPHEALGMKTPSQVYRRSAAPYAARKIELLYPERMLVRTVSGRGFIKYRSTTIQLTEALAGYPVAIDPHSGPPHDLWFSIVELASSPSTHHAQSLMLMSLPLLLSMNSTKTQT
jgi:putative transposase